MTTENSSFSRERGNKMPTIEELHEYEAAEFEDEDDREEDDDEDEKPEEDDED